MNASTRLSAVAVGALLALSCSCPGVAASDGPGQADRPSSLTTTVWISGMFGDATVRGTPVPVSLSIGEAWRSLDDLKTGISLHYEWNRGAKGRLGYLVDLMYYKFQFTRQTVLGNTEVEPSQFLGELGGIYTLSASPVSSDRFQDLALLGGVRFSQLKASLEVEDAGIDVSRDRSWADGFIGARLRYDLSRKWLFTLRGDVGAGGSDFTWNAIGDFQYRLSGKRTINLGWRILHQEYETGSGTDQFRWNVDQSGPFLATTMSW